MNRLSRDAGQLDATPSTAAPTTNVFFNSHEAAFVDAVCVRLISLNELGPGAVEAAIRNYSVFEGARTSRLIAQTRVSP